MTNPVSLIPSAQLPQITSEIVDPGTGIATGLFYRFIVGLWQRSGGVAGISASDVQQVSAQALTIAEAATQQASLAITDATAAQITANQAVQLANNAQTTANNATGSVGSLNAKALLAANNLGDVGSITSSRANLGVDHVAINFSFDTTPSGLKKYYPLVQNLTLPANFQGSYCHCGIGPSADSVFYLQRLSGGVLTTLGGITVASGASGYNFSSQPSVSLLAGDTLILACPSPADSSLAQIGFTFLLSLA